MKIADKISEDCFRYIYTQKCDKDHKDLTWSYDVPHWCIANFAPEAQKWLESADILLSGLRDFDLFERRAAKGLKNYYMSERWFKPPIGILRLLHPKYFVMAWRVVKLLRTSPFFYYLPIGIHAARDMARLCGLIHGDLRCLFRAPKLHFERRPFGKVWAENKNDNEKYCLDKMRMWGYFVEPSGKAMLPVQGTVSQEARKIKVLWVGRLLNLKRVDTIVRAVSEHENLKRVDKSLPIITLDIYGDGPAAARLKRLAGQNQDVIKFYPPVSLAAVRQLMREHDVYVLSSNAYEGWGAVVSEALEEGMKVLGTYESGSCATMLPEECLYQAGDWRALLRLLRDELPKGNIGNWTANEAAKSLVFG